MSSAAKVKLVQTQITSKIVNSPAGNRANVDSRTKANVRLIQRYETRTVRDLLHQEGLRATWSTRIRTGTPAESAITSR